MSISNTLQQVGFTSGDDLLYGTLRSLNLQVKNTCKGGRVIGSNGTIYKTKVIKIN